MAADASRADRRGIFIASVCFIHCIAGPFLLSFAGLASVIGFSERLEPLFLLASGVLGVIALLPAYRGKHGRISCIAMFIAGLLCLVLKRFIGGHPASFETVATIAGAALIVGAHALNLRYSRNCACCAASEVSDADPDRKGEEWKM